MRIRSRRRVNTEVRSPMERPAVFAGALRDPNESGSLSVTLSVWSDQIVMHNDDVELGEWPRESVRIIPLDSTSYEFLAEGDRLLFVPDDRVAFASVATTGTSTTSSQTTKKRTKVNPTATPKATKPVKAKRSRKATAASRPSKREKAKTPPKPKPASSKTAAVVAASTGVSDALSSTKRRMKRARTPQRGIDTGPVSPTTQEVRPSGAVAGNAASVQAAAAHTRTRKAMTLRVPSLRRGRSATTAPAATTSAGAGTRPKRWIKLIDAVRVYSVFGLDRVPVDVSLRGAEHQHTWDHRAAAPSGPSKHICTICGRLKF